MTVKLDPLCLRRHQFHHTGEPRAVLVATWFSSTPNPGCKFVFVGNKMDQYKTDKVILTLENRKVNDKREIERALGIKELEVSSNFFFVSAKVGHNVDSLLIACKRMLCDGNQQVERAIEAGKRVYPTPDTSALLRME